MKTPKQSLGNHARTYALAALFSALAAVQTANADTIFVTSTADDGSPGTLRAALAAANDGDTIDATGISGTILLTAGNLLIQDSVAILGPGAASLSVDGNQLSGVFFIAGNLTVTIDGISIVNGNAVAASGGGIFNQANLTISNCTLSGNSGNFGGGIVNRLAPLTVINCTFTNNSARNDGGGIYNSGSDFGGSVSLTVINSTFSGNTAAEDGGAIYNNGSNTVERNARLLVIGATFSGNKGDFGGGAITNASGLVEIANSTFSGNSAEVGGGIFNNGLDGAAQMVVVNSTFTGNFDLVASASILNSGTGAVLHIGGTILKTANDNFASEGGAVVVSLGFNIVSDDGDGAFSALGDRINTDPMLGPLADNGGPTLTHTLLAGSPAVDGGSSDTLAAFGLSTDQRGLARTIDDLNIPNASFGDGTDVGAVEVPAAPPPPPPVPVADVGITFLGADKVSVKQGEVLTYTIAVRNFGPDTATNVMVNNLMSSGTGFLNARATKGTFAAPPVNESGAVIWNLGDMANGTAEGAELIVSVLVKGKTTVTNLATVQSDADDPNAENNVASITTSVAAGGNNGGGGGKKK